MVISGGDGIPMFPDNGSHNPGGLIVSRHPKQPKKGGKRFSLYLRSGHYRTYCHAPDPDYDPLATPLLPFAPLKTFDDYQTSKDRGWTIRTSVSDKVFYNQDQSDAMKLKAEDICQSDFGPGATVLNFRDITSEKNSETPGFVASYHQMGQEAALILNNGGIWVSHTTVRFFYVAS